MQAGSNVTEWFAGLSLRNWRAEMRPEGVMVLYFDREGASANSISQSVLIELDTIIERLNFEPPKGLVIASGKDKGFVAGADIKEFASFDAKGTVGDAIARG